MGSTKKISKYLTNYRNTDGGMIGKRDKPASSLVAGDCMPKGEGGDVPDRTGGGGPAPRESQGEQELNKLRLAVGVGTIRQKQVVEGNHEGGENEWEAVVRRRRGGPI